jgi:hypothetical protein
LFAQDLFDGQAFVLPEIKDFDPVVIVDNAPHIVDGAVVGREFAQFLYVVDDGSAFTAVLVFVFGIGIGIELRLEHLIGRTGVGHRRMGIGEFPVQVKLIGCAECSLFHFMVDGLHIDKFPLFKVYVDVAAEEFLGQEGNVKTVGVESGQVAPFQEADQVAGYFTEYGSFPDILIGDTVYAGSRRRNRYFRIDAQKPLFLISIGVNLQQGNFHDPVAGNVNPGGFQIDKNQGVLQI